MSDCLRLTLEPLSEADIFRLGFDPQMIEYRKEDVVHTVILHTEDQEDLEVPRLIVHPMSVAGKAYPLSVVLLDLAAQEGCDGEPYDTMVAAAQYIDQLEEFIVKHKFSKGA